MNRGSHQHGHLRVECAMFESELKGVANLTQDLALADDPRFQARRDAQKMLGCG
jgi:hypothetical protein